MEISCQLRSPAKFTRPKKGSQLPIGSETVWVPEAAQRQKRWGECLRVKFHFDVKKDGCGHPLPPLVLHVSCNGRTAAEQNECFALSSHPSSSSGEELKRKFLSNQNVDMGSQETYPLQIWHLQLTWRLSDSQTGRRCFAVMCAWSLPSWLARAPHPHPLPVHLMRYSTN